MKKVYGKVMENVWAVLSDDPQELHTQVPKDDKFKYISKSYKRPRDVVRRVTETANKMGWEVEWVK